ncbi:hypothetical protein JXA63_03820 [Candidatus Woesebacteria bacterium]|nr:hypothetical protein [Candidatus Woesebacteria bacterium]
MSINYKKVRSFLFANSYSANKIAVHLNAEYKGRKLEKVSKNLAVVLRFRQKQIINFVLFDIKSECPYQRIPKSIRLYLEIEKELLKLSEEKLDEYSTASEDYQNQLLSPAIERAVGNFLTDVKNDKRFQNLLEDKIKSAHYTYYKIAYKYALPTMRTVPYILRLVYDTN